MFTTEIQEIWISLITILAVTFYHLQGSIFA